jgi:hypothetical protein
MTTVMMDDAKTFFEVDPSSQTNTAAPAPDDSSAYHNSYPQAGNSLMHVLQPQKCP